MPVYLTINAHGDEAVEAKRSLTNFFELCNQQKLCISDNDKENIGKVITDFNSQMITIHQLKSEINDTFIRIGGQL